MTGGAPRAPSPAAKAPPQTDDSHVLDDADAGTTLAAALRKRMPGRSWNDVRRLVETGKVRVNGDVVVDAAVRVNAGARVTLSMTAPRPRAEIAGFRVAFEDGHVIIIEKPSGVTSVPYERKDTGTALDLIRAHWRRAGKRATTTPLYTVHRIDKDTSGLLCFAKTRLAERALHDVFQRHTARREYLAVAEGAVDSRRIESTLVADRGDGIRGSANGRWARAGLTGDGQRAITHVTALRRLRAATLLRVRLETGRTHQIRIHLSEAGHPLVGETVYIRDLLRAGGQPLPSPRLMLHAATLGLPHPVTGEPIDLRAAPPPDFLETLEALGGARQDVDGVDDLGDGDV
ncbi:MAG TPA: RluA family pseudouridine synthase [Polyangia bacterium]|nr:RluA family pseudouridine synthase [Polyangia bacterium]